MNTGGFEHEENSYRMNTGRFEHEEKTHMKEETSIEDSDSKVKCEMSIIMVPHKACHLA